MQTPSIKLYSSEAELVTQQTPSRSYRRAAARCEPELQWVLQLHGEPSFPQLRNKPGKGARSEPGSPAQANITFPHHSGKGTMANFVLPWNLAQRECWSSRGVTEGTDAIIMLCPPSAPGLQRG